MVPHMWVTAGEVLGGPEENRNLPTTWEKRPRGGEVS